MGSETDPGIAIVFLLLLFIWIHVLTYSCLLVWTPHREKKLRSFLSFSFFNVRNRRGKGSSKEDTEQTQGPVTGTRGNASFLSLSLPLSTPGPPLAPVMPTNNPVHKTKTTIKILSRPEQGKD